MTSLETRFEHVDIGQHFFVVYDSATVCCYLKKSLSTAYMISLETWERVGDWHNIIEVSKSMPVVAIAQKAEGR